MLSYNKEKQYEIEQDAKSVRYDSDLGITIEGTRRRVFF